MVFLKKTLIALICLYGSATLAQQITVDNSFTPEALITNNLVVGCVETSNVVSDFNGSINGFNSYAYFEKGSSEFPFENGIMLSTGNPMSGGNTLNNTILNEGNDDWIADPDLESALGISNTLNATSISFNFTSITDRIQFNYILASEEYFGNFPCEYSDGFAFLIKEAGSSDPYVNIAVIPGTTTAVNTNTIHDEIVGYCPASNAAYFEGFNVGDTNYNGRTTVMSATAAITPYTQYSIKLVIADQTDKNYDSAVFIEGNSFNSNVDLGEDITTCASNVTLEGDISNPQATYAWYLDDVLIPGEITSTIQAIASGIYKIEIQIPLAGSNCVIEDSVAISLSSTQSAEAITDYQLCDDNGNSREIFDLAIKDAEVLDAVPNSSYVISYHYTASSAENNSNPIVTPIENTSNPQSIFVRIEDSLNGCLAYSSFQLKVNAVPLVTAPTVFLACAEVDAGGSAIIDLSEKDEEITGGNPDLNVTYYLDPVDAANGVNAIPLPYVNSNANEQVYVRVTNTVTGCVSTTTLTIEVINKPVINGGLHVIDACDQDHDGFAFFDLTTITDDVLQGLTGVNVTFHQTLEDANLGANAIADATNYANVVADESVVFIRVEDQNTGCASVTAIEIHTNLLLTGTDIKKVTRCDIDNDGQETFDLGDIALDIINGLEDVTIDFYLTEEDRDTNTNPLDPTGSFVPTSNPQFLYITLSNPTCSEVAAIELIINPVIEGVAIGSQLVCDEDQDGFTSLNLNQFNDVITGGQPGFSVKYYLTEEDASNNSNAVPSSYTNISNPQTFYYRARFNQTGCADVKAFEVTVLEAPISAAPTGIIICDTDQDGFSIVNLNAKTSEVINNTANRAVTFHTSVADAETDTDPILDASNFNAQTQDITVRIENVATGCYSLQNLEIIVNTLPVINPISVYKYCEVGDDGFGEFVFSSQDADILETQTGKVVFYYETAIDADNNTNAIDKEDVYVNSSNPQTIHIRVENISDPSCYAVSSFPIEVGTNPDFNEATDIFVCDDITNDGSVMFDLSIQMGEITAGIQDIEEVTLHASQQDAINNVNPLPLDFENNVNPQQIYARINNGSICESYTSFVLNVIAAPDVNIPEPLEQCDADYDGISNFDLTLSALDILDVRQDNIEVGYYRTEADAVLESNEITDPANFTNTSNPQTVYVRVSNTISNCFVNVPVGLIVNLPPTINFIDNYNICATEDQRTDLSEINSSLLNQTANVLVNYYASEEDARNQTNVLDNNYNYQSNNDLLFARVEFSTTHCFIIHDFNLKVNALPVANQPSDMAACDDDFDGFLNFDLSTQNSSILGGQNPNNFEITFYTDVVFAQEGVADIGTIYEGINNEIIYARLENKFTDCYEITQFSLIIYERPIVNIDDQVICLENLPLVVSANTNITGDSYLWSTNASTPEIEITEVGSYSVTVTSTFGCETTQVFSVIESEAANIEVTEVIDFSDPNNVTVTVSGIGNYLYQIDDLEPQESNFFESVPLGYHILTIIDLNGCSRVSKEIVVIDAPKFMTPNGDGYFDSWHITGVETLQGTVIFIYDRYGKLLTKLTANSEGWDGYYNGQKMPAADYWYLAQVKKNSIEFEVKGHFTIRH